MNLFRALSTGAAVLAFLTALRAMLRGPDHYELQWSKPMRGRFRVPTPHGLSPSEAIVAAGGRVLVPPWRVGARYRSRAA